MTHHRILMKISREKFIYQATDFCRKHEQLVAEWIVPQIKCDLQLHINGTFKILVKYSLFAIDEKSSSCTWQHWVNLTKFVYRRIIINLTSFLLLHNAVPHSGNKSVKFIFYKSPFDCNNCLGWSDMVNEWHPTKPKKIFGRSFLEISTSDVAMN